MKKTLSEIVNNSCTKPGDPWDFVVKRSLLPPIPAPVHDWIADPDRTRCLYLVGPFKSGKTWAGIFAAMSLQEPEMGVWSEHRYLEDLERRRWYERVIQSDARNDSLWKEFNEYERLFVSLQLRKLLVVDDLYYWNLSDYKQAEMDRLIKQRLDHGLTTIVCAARLPEPGSLLAQQLREYGLTVPLKALG